MGCLRVPRQEGGTDGSMGYCHATTDDDAACRGVQWEENAAHNQEEKQCNRCQQEDTESPRVNTGTEAGNAKQEIQEKCRYDNYTKENSREDITLRR